MKGKTNPILNQGVLKPKLRFPLFNQEWECLMGRELFLSSRKKGNPSLPIYSVTIGNGLVPRTSLERRIGLDADAEQNLLVEPGDIVYNMMRMWQGAYGVAVKGCMVSPAYVVLKPKEIVSSNFIYYKFNCSRSLYLFGSYSYGLTQDRLRLYYKDFERIKFYLPSLPEQQKIASFLSAVDKKIQQLTRKKELLEKYKKGVMQKLFSRTIVFKSENEEDNFWNNKPLNQIATFYSGGTPASSNSQYYGGDIPFIKSGEIGKSDTAQYLTRNGMESSSAKLVMPGDLLYAMYGATAGELALSKISGAINQAVLCIRPTINTKYLYYYLVYMKSRIINRYLQGGQGNLSAEIIKSIVVSYPSSKTQKLISELLSNFDKKIEKINSQIDLNKSFKKALLQQLFV